MQQDAELNVQCLLRKKFVSLSTLKIFYLLYIFRDYCSIIFFPIASIRASVHLV